GVYLMARMYPLLEVAPGVLTGMAVVGVFTALLAATMALVASDIKRVLAYSTISQLGYMVAGLALGGVAVGIFHLFTHAFFKALLFMGAGSISHAVGTFDMREMGGLGRKQPLTFAMFLIGALSLSGIWPMAGFFSKEEVLGSSWESSVLFFIPLIVTAFLTAFYIFRAVFLTFTGRYRGTAHPHESPPIMLVPMFILTVLAVGAGYFNANGGFASFLGHGETHGLWDGLVGVLTHPLAWWSLGAAILGIALAFALYMARWFSVERSRRQLRLANRVLLHKYWMDELYENLLARRLLYRGLFRAFAEFDRRIVDGAVNDLARLGINSGRIGRRAASGQLQFYSLAAILGIATLVIILLLVNTL
ncbi:MAG: NADH-quinone oxidoreductase subunit L, partial [Dehalococcoidia bacterium]|nr:NADH-quinone oxidoreductase subunit L [Dehalococcoidia bacterium]